MNDHNSSAHLTYDELLLSIADMSDLGAAQHAHLQSCHRCRRQSEDLTHRYRRLGRMAKSMAPEPSRPFRVPTHSVTPRRWYFKPGVALGVIGVMIFAFTLWWPQPTEHSQTPAPMAAWTQEEEARWVAEVDALVDDALPAAYQQVAVVSEPILSKDLIDWIVPSIDEEDENTEPTA